MQIFGGYFHLGIYLSLLFLVFLFCFKFFWFSKNRHLRSLIFSLVSALGYTIVHLISHALLKRPVQSNFITTYFMNGLMIMITISLGFNLAEFIMNKLNDTFFASLEIKNPGNENDEVEE
jgi:cation transport ATPase